MHADNPDVAAGFRIESVCIGRYGRIENARAIKGKFLGKVGMNGPGRAVLETKSLDCYIPAVGKEAPSMIPSPLSRMFSAFSPLTRGIRIGSGLPSQLPRLYSSVSS